MAANWRRMDAWTSGGSWLLESKHDMISSVVPLTVLDNGVGFGGALDFGEDILCRSCPDKGLGRLVARFQVLVDTEVQLGRKVLNNNDRARTACVRTHLLTLRLGKGRIPFPSLSVQQG